MLHEFLEVTHLRAAEDVSVLGKLCLSHMLWGQRLCL